MVDPSDAVVVAQGTVAELERIADRLGDHSIETEIVRPTEDRGSS